MLWEDERGRDVELFEQRLRESRWRRVARFRLGCEMRGGRYWEGKEERRCRLCGER